MRVFDYIWIGLLPSLLASCSDDSLDPDRAVAVSMALSVASPAVTRLDNNVTQTGSVSPRTLTDIHAIPYAKEGEIGADDLPLAAQPAPLLIESTGTYYLDPYYELPYATASFLCYARALPLGDGSKEVNGSITAPDLSIRSRTADIYFSPDQICPSVTPDERATAMAAYLTTIARTTGWSSSGDAKLLALYKNFIGEDSSDDYPLFAGSSASILGYLNELWQEVGKYESDATLAAAIRSAIQAGATVADDKVTALTAYNDTDISGYPASLGLPDGAAAMQWISDAFQPQTATTTITPINSLTRFAYPAELWFYANSRINTSPVERTAADYIGKSWEEVLALFEHRPGKVNSVTRSAAIVTPLRYGVASLRATVKAASATLLDADGESISVSATTFPLTGLLVSGQYRQRFDFTPDAEAATEYILYDSQVGDIRLSTTASAEFGTLTFQTRETDDPVSIVLEFENRSGMAFRGEKGIIYPGAKFYLIGTIARPKTPARDYEKRVFTQDYTTLVNMTVQSLAKAYNVLPDLQSSRMEIGVLLVPKWDAVTPTNTELF